MKQFIYILFLAVFGFTSCTEDELTPSLADQPSAKDHPDMSKPLIAQYKNDYGISIVYQFDTTADFLFSFHNKVSIDAWKRLSIKQFTPDNVDYGLEKLEELFLTYFKDEVTFNGETIRSDFKRKSFPKTIFIVDSLAGSYSSLGQYLKEPNGYETEKYYSFLWNDYEPMLAFNSKILTTNAANLNKYRNSILYCFLSSLFINRDLYSQLPESFFEPVSELYDTSVNDLATEEEAPTTGTGSVLYYDPAWYTSKGFALTSNSPTGSSGTTTNYTKLLRTTNSYHFPDRKRDFRNILHVIIYETNVTNIRNYFKNDVILPRIQTLIERLYDYGIDVAAINPATTEYFNN